MFNTEIKDGVITKIYGDDYELDFVEKSVSYTTPTGIAVMLEDLCSAVAKAVEYDEMKYDLEEMRTCVIGLKMDRDEARKKYQSNLEKEKSVSRKLTEKIEELEKTVKSLKNDYNYCRQALEDECYKTADLKRKHEKEIELIKELKALSENREEDVLDLDAVLKNKHEEIRQRDKIIKELREELKDCQNNNCDLITRKNELEEVNKCIIKSKIYWHDEWIKLHNDKNTLLTANENMSAEIKRLREEISDLNAINKKLNEKNKEPDIDDVVGISSELVKLIAEQTTLSSVEASYALHDLGLIGSPHIKNILNLMNSIASNYKSIDSERRKYQSERDTLKKEISKLENRKKERDEWRDRYLSLKEYHDTTNKTLTDELKVATKENFELKRALNKTYGICYNDLHDMYPCTYSDAAKEILRWLDVEFKNGTDYATKIFKGIFEDEFLSIIFCKVPAVSSDPSEAIRYIGEDKDE